ncbi:unnamed protein product [Diplocarpon coronariae]
MADSWEPFETREIEQMRDQIVEHSRRFDQWRRQQLNEMWGSQAYLDENLRRFLVICEEKNTQQDRREKELCDREEKVKRLQNPTYLKRHDEEMMALRCFASAMLVTDLKLQDYTRKLRQNMTEIKHLCYRVRMIIDRCTEKSNVPERLQVMTQVTIRDLQDMESEIVAHLNEMRTVDRIQNRGNTARGECQCTCHSTEPIPRNLDFPMSPSPGALHLEESSPVEISASQPNSEPGGQQQVVASRSQSARAPAAQEEPAEADAIALFWETEVIGPIKNRE